MDDSTQFSRSQERQYSGGYWCVVFIDSVWSRCTPRYFTESWKGMLRHQYLQILSQRNCYPLMKLKAWSRMFSFPFSSSSSSFFFFLSAFRLFVALSPWQIISYAGLNVWLSKKETPRWCTVRQLCVISILVILTAMGRYYGVCEYRLNSTGPRTDSWGTPKPRGVGEDIKPSTTTDCTLSVKPGRCYSWDPQSSLLVCLWHVSKSVLLLLLLFYIPVLSMESVKFHCLGLPAMSVSGVCYRRVWKW